MSLVPALEAVDARRRALVERLRRMPPDLLERRLAPEKWSILEITEHLVRVENDVMGDPAQLAARAARSQGLGHRLRYWLVMALLRFSVPVKAPSAGMIPTGEPSLEELLEAWDRNHELLAGFARSLGPGDAERAIFRHPVTGPITVRQAVQMLGVHLDTHVRQIDRIERSEA